MTNITAVRVTNSFTLKEVKVMHHTSLPLKVNVKVRNLILVTLKKVKVIIQGYLTVNVILLLNVTFPSFEKNPGYVLNNKITKSIISKLKALLF